MSDLRTAAQQALEALDKLYLPGELERVNAAITALRAALAQQAEPVEPVEPVAYIHRQGNYWDTSERHLTDDEKARGWTEEPLYTAPPPPQRKQAEPEPLPPEQRQRWEELAAMPQQAEPVEPVAREHMLAKHIEFQRAETQRYFELYNRACETARLRLQEIASLESRLAAQPVQEPAYKVEIAGRWHNAEPLPPAFSLPDGEHLLYTAPPQRKPLTEEEIGRFCDEVYWSPRQLVRAVERAHGIKE